MKFEKSHIYAIIIIITFSIINIIWIFNYSPEINSEDMILVGKSLKFIQLKDASSLNFNSIYFSISQPLMSYLYFQSIEFINSPFSPYFVNLFFYIILAVSTFLIVSDMYNETSALISLFITFTLPILVAYSRILYATTALIALFTLSLYFYFKSKKFLKTKWSILCGLTCSLTLLTYYTMLSYVGTMICLSFFAIFFPIKNKKFTNKKIINFFIFLLIILIISVPHYLKEGNLSNFNSRSNLKQESFMCNLLNYPSYIINYQLGFFLAIIFTISIVFIFLNILKKKINEKELFILLIIGINFLFYSFVISIKNTIVTGLFTSLLIILISGIFSKNIPYKYILMGIVIINGLILISPLQINSEIPILNYYGKSMNCNNTYTFYFMNKNFMFFNKENILGKKLLEYKKQPNQIQNISKYIHSLSNEIYLLDLTTQNNFEFDYYFYFLDKRDFKYIRCKDVYLKPNFSEKFNFFVIGEINYSFADKTYHNSYTQKEIIECDKIRTQILSGDEYSLIFSPSEKFMVFNKN